eukprot:TRINITY_DN1055_c0_g1_i1.p1 TRINITY_DN1055_c0_g1~~TRINITY_DN1055_c0_g1_i1.p1  ORF type:complete len:226 (-),score=40.06 TRINITY_DN1055_c0_g1_i1:81-731(-)
MAEGSSSKSYLDLHNKKWELWEEIMSKPWKKVSSKKDITVEELSGYEHPFYRSVGIVNIPLQAIMNGYGKPEYRLKWDVNLELFKIVEVLPSKDEIIYTKSKAVLGGVVSPRDFVQFRSVKQKENLWKTYSTSVEHKDVPPISAAVRGFDFLSGIEARSIIDEKTGKADKTELIVVLSVDIKGWFISSIKKQAISTTAFDLFNNFRSAFEKGVITA